MSEPKQADQSQTQQPPTLGKVENISVAVLYPGNRVQKMQIPLEASRLDVSIEPENPYERDIVLCDNADRNLAREVLKKVLHDAMLVYRMRGDVFHELKLWDMHPVKRYINERFVFPNVDGCLAVSDRLATKFQQETGIGQVGSAGLCKQLYKWPDISHTDHEIRALTLTNANYWQKVKPIAEWAPIVDGLLADTGGTWHVCASGDHTEELARALRDYQNVEFQGYVEAKQYLARSNVLLHPSNLDGQPNSVLEGLASRLPVVTTTFAAFTDFDGPIRCCETDDLESTLRQLADPEVREQDAARGIKYMKENHTPEAIAKQYERFFHRLVYGSN